MSFPRHKTPYPRAIIHIDGDSFFASCEQSRNPSLTGKAVVTGKDRGIASSMSLEAKALGITRAMPIHEIKRRFPHVIIIPSDYETYALLSARFMSIVRRYTPDVEEYSIDECFADITGLRKTHRMSYEKICLQIQKDLNTELNCTFSIGLAPSKTLAKVGSKWQKSDTQNGFTAISAQSIKAFLEKLPVDEVWNIGPQTTAFLQKHGIRTAYQFATRDESWIRNTVNINFYATWNELRGISKMSLKTRKRDNTHSIQRVRTFTPPSNNPEYLLARLKENVEIACMRARAYNSEAKEISLFLKSEDFSYSAIRIKLSRPTHFSHEIYDAITPAFKEVYDKRKRYRATGITLSKLSIVSQKQLDLFDSHLYVEKMGKVYTSIDTIGKKHGKNTIHIGTHAIELQKGSKSSHEKEVQKVLTNKKSQKLGYPLLLGTFADI